MHVDNLIDHSMANDGHEADNAIGIGKRCRI